MSNGDFDWGSAEKRAKEATPGAPPFLEADEKKALVESGDSFWVAAAPRQHDGQFGPRWYVDVAMTQDALTRYLQDPGPDAATENLRTLGFDAGNIGARDVVLRMMREHFEKGGEPISCVLVQEGRVRLLRPSE